MWLQGLRPWRRPAGSVRPGDLPERWPATREAAIGPRDAAGRVGQWRAAAECCPGCTQDVAFGEGGLAPQPGEGDPAFPIDGVHAWNARLVGPGAGGFLCHACLHPARGASLDRSDPLFGTGYPIHLQRMMQFHDRRKIADRALVFLAGRGRGARKPARPALRTASVAEIALPGRARSALADADPAEESLDALDDRRLRCHVGGALADGDDPPKPLGPGHRLRHPGARIGGVRCVGPELGEGAGAGDDADRGQAPRHQGAPVPSASAAARPTCGGPACGGDGERPRESEPPEGSSKTPPPRKASPAASAASRRTGLRGDAGPVSRTESGGRAAGLSGGLDGTPDGVTTGGCLAAAARCARTPARRRRASARRSAKASRSKMSAARGTGSPGSWGARGSGLVDGHRPPRALAFGRASAEGAGGPARL